MCVRDINFASLYDFLLILELFQQCVFFSSFYSYWCIFFCLQHTSVKFRFLKIENSLLCLHNYMLSMIYFGYGLSRFYFEVIYLQSRAAYARGDIASSKENSRSAKQLTNIGMAAGAVSLVIAMILMGVYIGLIVNMRKQY